MDFLELCELAELSPTQVLCHVSACAAKSWKSTKVTRRNTLSKMVPKDLKEVKKEVDKELKEQKKNQKAKKGSKKKDEKKKGKSKRRSLTKKPEKKTHYADREGTSYEKRNSYIKPERTASYMRPERSPQPELAPMLSPTDAHVKPSRSPMRAQQPDRSPMRAQQPDRSPMHAQQP